MICNLAIDQGTISTGAISFDAETTACASTKEDFAQHFPYSGWVEHNPRDLWGTTLSTCRKAIRFARVSPSKIAAVGIINQRETAIVWDTRTGEPLHNAIVWQDRRTADICATMRNAGQAEMITQGLRLLLDPYLSSTKLKWILEAIDGARACAQNGELMFGTIDAFFIWKLTDGKLHATDATNATCTMLHGIRKGRWSSMICKLHGIPMQMLPEVKDGTADFGITRSDLFGSEAPVKGFAGDQQGATIGQAYFEPGMMKSTYCIGCVALMNIGDAPAMSKNRLLAKIAYQFYGKLTYALEGFIFVAGAVVHGLWARLQIIQIALEMQALAEAVDSQQNVILVPPFVGLGATYWYSDCGGTAFVLTRSTGPAEMAKTYLRCIGYQIRKLLQALATDRKAIGVQPTLRVNGDMATNDWAMPCLTGNFAAPLDRPLSRETTALGCAWIVGMHAGVYPNQAAFAETWTCETQSLSAMGNRLRTEKFAAWDRAIHATMGV